MSIPAFPAASSPDYAPPDEEVLPEELPSPDHPCYRVWREYAASAIARGQLVASTLETHRSLAGQRVLDLGCGGGGLAVALAQHGAAVLGMDLDIERVQIATRRAQRAGASLSLLLGDALHVPVETDTVDVVVCNDVLEHVPDASRCLAEVRRILRPGGLLYLAVPNRWSLPNLWADPHYRLPLVAALPRRWAAPLVTQVWRRNQRYTVEELLAWSRVRRLLAEHEFVIRDQRSDLLDWRLRYLLAKLHGEEVVLAPRKRRLKRLLDVTGLGAIAAGMLRSGLAMRWWWWARGWAIVAQPG